MPVAPTPLRVVVLISGTGSLLLSVLEAIDRGELDVEVVAVGSDRVAPGLAWAEQAGVPTFVLPLERGADRAAWDRVLTEQVAAYAPDLVVSAGFMRLVGPAFLARYSGRFVNTHPALLPSFPGVHGVREALAYGVKVTGCTIFLVDEGVDTGPILDQVAVRVLPDDDEASLHERIKVEERRLLRETLRSWPARWAAGAATRALRAVLPTAASADPTDRGPTSPSLNPPSQTSPNSSPSRCPAPTDPGPKGD